jgi:hypothetical protein
MNPRPAARLSLQTLEGRDLPGSAPLAPPTLAAAATSATTTASRTVQVADLTVAQGAKRHYPHIRVAMLAYTGTPVGTFESKMLRESVDLIIPNVSYLDKFEALAPGTPQMIYSNVSNIYLELYADWVDYADRRGFDREGAFYHVTRATTFTGDSGSSRPVNWFWSIQRGSDASGWADFTQVARNNTPQVTFAPAGQSVVIGFPEKFREINVYLRSPGSSSWAARLEYATARDSAGRPTGWRGLNTLSDTTSGLRRSGTITFDPPSDWRTGSVNGSENLFFVRFRTTGLGTAPIGYSVQGRDYVNARGRNTGTVPAFDELADRNHDGYLSDTEFRYRRPGADARFEYESRVFYPAYGQMRFATNPADGGFRNWAVDYARRFLDTHPHADGLFLDNSYGRLQVDARTLREPLTKYADDYASLLGSIESGIGAKWVLANTAGSGKSAEPLAKYGVSYVEEFALRPLAHNWQQFEDVAKQTADRFRLMGPNGFAVLDTYPAGGSPTDPRTQIASLAYYYLLADPDRTFVMFNGGFEPSSSWSRHWTDAVKYDVGRPRGTWSVFARGDDPSNTNLDYKVYQRQYDRALVLYKPLSYTAGRTGSTGYRSATSHTLPGRFRELRSDGSLGPVVTRVSLRNGEGAILIRA